MSTYTKFAKWLRHRTRQSGPRSRPRRRALAAEPLERRALLAAMISIGDASVVEEDGAYGFVDEFVPNGSAGLARARGTVFGPDGNGDGSQDLYVASGDTDEIIRFDGISGTFIDAFVTAGSGGLDSPFYPIFGPDGNGDGIDDLYVTDASSILRFNGTNGSFIDVFASAGSGGMELPIGLVFGPDANSDGFEDLYVVSRGASSDNVLEFAGPNGINTGGAFLAEFVDSNSGGLLAPHSLRFGPDGHLYVTSTNTNSVMRYDGTSGNPLPGPLGSPGTAEFVPSNSGNLYKPGGLLFKDGMLYVASTNTTPSLIHRYDAATGNFIDSFNKGTIDSLGIDAVGWGMIFGPDNNLYVGGGARFGGWVIRFSEASVAAFAVTLSEPSATEVTVDFATADGTATSGVDYSATSGTLRFAPGETSKTVIVPTLDDTQFESAETFFVNISNPTGGASIADGQGQGTIEASTATEPNWFELQEVTDGPAFGQDANFTGFAIDETTLVVGDRFDDSAATNAGAVYVYSFDDNQTPGDPTDDNWRFDQKIVPDDLQTGDHFGSAVSLEGGRLVISADHASNCCLQLGDGLGVAYVFGQQLDGTWQLDQKLDPVGRGGINDRFGNHGSTALEGDLIAVGANFDDNFNGVDAGAVHVFRFNGFQWNHEAKLIAPGGNAGDKFGQSVRIDGGEIIASSPIGDGNEADSGLAYVFSESSPGSGDWAATAILQASAGEFDDRFGNRVAKEGDTIVVTARLEDAAGANSGAAYVFERTNGIWQETAKLLPNDLEAGDTFGADVAIVNGTIAVNASSGNGLVFDTGSTYFFERIEGVWQVVDQVAASQSVNGTNAFFSSAVAMSSTHFVTGASIDAHEQVFIFSRDDSRTRETQISTDTPLSIRDARGNRTGKTNTSIEMTEPLEVIDVNIRLDISHSSTDQLDVFLSAPDGTRVELFSDVGGTGNNFVATIIDDDAAADIASASAPFTGNFRPEGNLNAFRGKEAQGIWTLEIEDDQRGTSGTLNHWSLSILGRVIGAPSEPPTGDDSDLYVQELEFDSRVRGKNGSIHDERVIGTVRRDSDGDGVAETSDLPAAAAQVTIEVTGPESRTFTVTTDSLGQLTTGWLKNVPDGVYTATVTGLVLDPFVWNVNLGVTEETHSVPHPSAALAPPPETLVALSGLGGSYSQDFDALGSQGAGDAPLPDAWQAIDGGQATVTTTGSFPAGLSGVFGAGSDADADRALVVDGAAGNSLELLGEVVDADLSSVQVRFDLEVWAGMPLATTGEAALDVALQADTGSGFTTIAELGRVTTGETLSPPIGEPGKFTSAVGVPGTSPSTVIASADFNDDGRLDFAAASFDTGGSARLQVHLGQGDGTFSQSEDLPGLSFPNDIVVAHFDDDGHLDIAVSDYDPFELLAGRPPSDTDGVRVYLGRGDGTFAMDALLIDGLGPGSLVAEDFDGDEVVDLAVANVFSDDVSVFFGNGDGSFFLDSFFESFPISTGLGPWSITSGDFDGDGVIDLATADIDGGSVTLLWNTGGPFVDFLSESIFFADAPWGVVSGDLNGDGDLDLVVSHFNDAAGLDVLMSAGDGSFADPVRYSPQAFFGRMSLVDLNDDQLLDLVLPDAERSNGVTILFNQGDSTFGEPTLLETEGTVDAVTSGDMDGDGDQDLLGATDAAVELLFNGEILLDGNDAANRTSFDSGVVPANLPVGAFWRIVFEVPADFASAGYIFGLDNFELESIPETRLSGDHNGDGVVDQADLDLVLLHWGVQGGDVPDTWTGPRPNGAVDQDELDAVLLNWGESQSNAFDIPQQAALGEDERSVNVQSDGFAKMSFIQNVEAARSTASHGRSMLSKGDLASSL